MEYQRAKLILDRLNEKTEIDYCSLNEAEVINIILNADIEQDEHLSEKNCKKLMSDMQVEDIPKERLSNCCLSPMTEVSDGLGRCSNCKEGCVIEKE